MSARLLPVLAVFFLWGCGVQREMVFTSDPPNALVYLNGDEIGRTPVEHDFLWYGKYDVVVRKEGYVTARTTTNVEAPWWQWVPFDFFAELMPVRLRDKQLFTYSLLPGPTQPADSDLMLENAAEYRAKLEGAGTTQPTIVGKKTKQGTATTKPHHGHRKATTNKA
jgi:PEGA domain